MFVSTKIANNTTINIYEKHVSRPPVYTNLSQTTVASSYPAQLSSFLLVLSERSTFCIFCNESQSVMPKVALSA